AQVQTQNKVTLATPRLPTEVNQQGIVVVKQNPDFLMFVSIKSDDGKLDSKALDNLLATSVVDQIGRVAGVGSIFRLGSEYAGRLEEAERGELGPGNCGHRVVYNGQAVSGFGVQLVSGANALDVAELVKAKMVELQPTFPPGVSWFVPYDTTQFIRISIEEVV